MKIPQTNFRVKQKILSKKVFKITLITIVFFLVNQIFQRLREVNTLINSKRVKENKKTITFQSKLILLTKKIDKLSKYECENYIKIIGSKEHEQLLGADRPKLEVNEIKNSQIRRYSINEERQKDIVRTNNNLYFIFSSVVNNVNESNEIKYIMVHSNFNIINFIYDKKQEYI